MEENKKNIKDYISYSELKIWKECPYRHKLTYIDKVKEKEESLYLSFGRILHKYFEELLKNKSVDYNLIKNELEKEWEEKGFDTEVYIQKQVEKAKKQDWVYKHPKLEKILKSTKILMDNLVGFLDENFKNWELFSTEEQIKVPIEGKEINFKGYVDAIIKYYDDKNKIKYAIIDWKTAGSGGWNIYKQRDFNLKMQLFLYKIFFSKKYSVNLKDIECSFVIAKRTGKTKHLTKLRVPSGPKSLEKTNKILRNMLTSVEKKLFLKNKTSCRFCEFNKTEFCK